MSKTTVHFLRKNRRIKDLKIKASVGFIEFENGFYIISPDHINRVSKNGIMKKGSEIFFFEGNPSAIPFKVRDKKSQEPSRKYLDDMIYVNFLEQTGEPISQKYKGVMNMIRPALSLANLFRILLVALVVGTLLRGWLTQIV
jgi:hypothetical protein